MQTVIDDFHGQNFFLDNFFPSLVYMDGIGYPTIEHAFQAAKSLDPFVRAAIRKCQTPGEAKAMGRRVVLRADWETVKYDVMEALVRQKFTAHRQLHKKLLRTGSTKLIEGNTWNDRTWGMVRINDKWKGNNWLGKILMKIRDELREQLCDELKEQQ